MPRSPAGALGLPGFKRIGSVKDFYSSFVSRTRSGTRIEKPLYQISTIFQFSIFFDGRQMLSQGPAEAVAAVSLGHEV